MSHKWSFKTVRPVSQKPIVKRSRLLSFDTAKLCVISEVYETDLRTFVAGQISVMKQIAIASEMIMNHCLQLAILHPEMGIISGNGRILICSTIFSYGGSCSWSSMHSESP